MSREKSLELLKLESLLNRISTHHPLREEIANRLGRLSAGRFGEATADHYMQYLPGRRIQDVRIHDGIQPFQIDTLLISKKCLVILEVKNYKGELHFDLDQRKLIRTIEGKSEIFQDPFVQIELQTFQLQRWLKRSGFPSIPISSFIVIANSNASLKFQGVDLSKRKRVMFVKQLPTHLTGFMESFEGKNVWADDHLNEFSTRIKSEYASYDSDVMKQYGITKEQLIWGVPCPYCRMLGMARRRDHWLCERCGSKSKDAHLHLLKDHQLLIGDTITNAEFSASTGIRSAKVARTLLNQCCTHNNRHSKARKYTIDLVR
ncbi:nuclease-related domain-containing protein [Halobacillus litoralis]|uniref:nuclease-related domain-containing protein n=1 Tax=Halobacillus litoralis TaxID=45668 RepID=UPI001CFDB45B|nr:nuclease-related domain-containing protein [Halobacillus litoralis]WLR47902.1 nuclease-related domain-containing protein [Halobacillus litoralis]